MCLLLRERARRARHRARGRAHEPHAAQPAANEPPSARGECGTRPATILAGRQASSAAHGTAFLVSGLSVNMSAAELADAIQTGAEGADGSTLDDLGMEAKVTLATAADDSQYWALRFTGAVADKRGLIEEADGGVVFLDEIGEMLQTMRVRLLRFLQEREVRPVPAGLLLPPQRGRGAGAAAA